MAQDLVAHGATLGVVTGLGGLMTLFEFLS